MDVTIEGAGVKIETDTETLKRVGDSTRKTRFAKDQLKAFVERIERLEEEKKTIADDIKDIYGEAKSNGFDSKALRAVIRIRKLEPGEYQEHQLILDTYLNALGMLSA